MEPAPEPDDREAVRAFRRAHPALAETLRGVRERKLTYLPGRALRDLAQVVMDADAQRLPGSLIEAGCALGGSAIVMSAARTSARPMVIYDAFGMIPPPGPGDGPDAHARYQVIVEGQSQGLGGATYYGYRQDLLSEVRANLAAFGQTGVELVPGFFNETLHPSGPVAIAHIDADWYESVLTCLERIAPALVVGGRFVLDDYDQWSGCRRAADEWLAANPTFRAERRVRLHLVRDHAG
jgi:asparagine synthase (glutamine-hydrolysing)